MEPARSFRERAWREWKDPARRAGSSFVQTSHVELDRSPAVAIAAQERERRWLTFLAEAGELLGASLDVQTTLASIASLVVPEMADWCSVDLLEDGELRPVTVTHADPKRVGHAQTLLRNHPPDRRVTREVLGSGTSVLLAHVDVEQFELARALAIHSLMVVPLRARGRSIGALTFALSETPGFYDEADRAMAEELARRCALALDNAQLHTELKRALAQREAALADRDRLVREAQWQRQRLQAVLEQLPVAVLIADAPTGEIEFANERSRDLLGSLKDGRFPHGPLALHPDGRRYAPVELPIQRAMRGERISSEELILQRDDGRQWVLSASAVPVHDPQGAIVSAVSALQDVTDRKRSEDEARQHAQFMENFLGILGHDLRNPLQAITSSAHLLLRRGLAEGQAKAASRIAGSAERMGRLITDLLDFTRSRTGGGIPIVPALVCLPEIAKEIIEELEVANPGRQISLRADDDGCGEWDRDRISQVISNLVGNALQYGKRDRPIAVGIRDDHAHVVLSVHNEGTPIPAEVLPHVFEPFRRAVQPKDLGRSRGLGLGLYIARRIVQAHQGTIEVSSTEATGTTFTVRLPKTARASARN